MSTDPEAIMLTKAVVRAAEHLGLSSALADILGIEERAATNLASGAGVVNRGGAEWDNAKRFAGIFRALLQLVGSADNARTWLVTPHQTLGASPQELLRTAEGRSRVFNYLDAVQKYEIKLPPRGGSH